jgi:hypothetical protein
MQTFIKNIAELIKLKTIMSLVVVGVTSWGFTVDKISAELYVAITMAVITYYFTRNETKA